MGLFSSNKFVVDGKTILITGGSQGMGKSLGRLLAERGASVIIVARTESKLKEATEFISRFHYISADLSEPTECSRIIADATQLNNGLPPDVVWCCAGTSHPGLLVDVPASLLTSQMNSNYFSAAWTAQAALKSWIATTPSPSPSTSPSSSSPPTKPPTYHLILTSSLVAFWPVAGYSPYTPSKLALRGLVDTLSQEVLLYRDVADVRVAAVFPATILTEGYEQENTVKPDLTKMLEEDDDGQTPDQCAAGALAYLEQGRELVPTAALTRLLVTGSLGGSRRAPGFAGFVDYLMALVMLLVASPFRALYDSKVRKWAKTHGMSGQKTK